MRSAFLTAGLVLGILFLQSSPAAAGFDLKVELAAKPLSAGEVEFTVTVSGLVERSTNLSRIHIFPGEDSCWPKLLTKGEVLIVSQKWNFRWTVVEASCTKICLETVGVGWTSLKNGKHTFKLQFAEADQLPLMPFGFGYASHYVTGNDLLFTTNPDNQGSAEGKLPQIPLTFVEQVWGPPELKLAVGKATKLKLETHPCLSGCDYEIVVEEEATNDVIKQMVLAKTTVPKKEISPCLKNCTGKINAEGTAEPTPEVDTSSLDKEKREAWKGKTFQLKLLIKDKEGAPWLYSEVATIGFVK